MSASVIEMDIDAASDLEVIEVRVVGTLESKDYDEFTPLVDKFLKADKRVRVLFDAREFTGWTPGALWEDIKFDAKHLSDIDRVAIVANDAFRKSVAAFCKPFTPASVKIFDGSELDQARAWIEETDDSG